MKKTLPIVLAIALICALVVSCGPSQAMQDAQSTQTAAAIYATQTAQAPTNTATATSTATSTLTPTITPTPTQTPTPLPTATPTPKIYTGEWREYSFSEFQISLPENWKTIDINKEGIEAIRDLIQSIDTVWAQNMEPLITAEGMEEMLKLWAMDPEPAGVGYATVNITSQELPIANSTKSMSRQLESAFEQMGVEVLDIETDLLINNFDSARITLRLTMGPFSVKEYVYLFSVGQTMWVITFAVDETASYDYEGLFETVANSFHVVE